MNTRLLTELVSLRYKLQWAAVRTRSGRIILFLAGSIVLGTFAALALFAGFEGGLTVVHSGRAEAVARDAFSIIFLQAILVSNLMGLGTTEIFSETELRRFPLTALDRLIARHVIAILDPFWLLYLSLYLGLSMGLFVAGNGSIAPTAGAALRLFLCNYVAARMVGLALHHLAAAGAGVLVAAVLVAGAAVHYWIEFIPPFAAANSMAQGGFSGLLTILAWLSVLLPVLAWLEQRPTREQRRALPGAIVWDSLFDGVGRRFGPDLSPLVAFWLRFNCRNIIVRRFVWFAPAASAAIAYALYMDQHVNEPYGLLLTSLGALPIAASLVPGRVAVNRFGILDGGLKRLLLLPVRPSFLIRGSTYACTLVSSRCCR